MIFLFKVIDYLISLKAHVKIYFFTFVEYLFNRKKYLCVLFLFFYHLYDIEMNPKGLLCVGFIIFVLFLLYCFVKYLLKLIFKYDRFFDRFFVILPFVVLYFFPKEIALFLVDLNQSGFLNESFFWPLFFAVFVASDKLKNISSYIFKILTYLIDIFK